LDSQRGDAATQVTARATNTGTFTVVAANYDGSYANGGNGAYWLRLTGSTSQAFAPYGRVTQTSGGAVVGAVVTALVGLTPVAETSTDSGGNYQLAPLRPGVYALKVEHPTHASAARVLTLNASTARQDFQLAILPSAPAVTQVSRQPPISFTQPQVGPLGSTLKVFDGTQFVAITAGNMPSPDRMTIVLTHGWKGDPEAWAQGMAKQMRDQDVTPAIANIVAWDWQVAAVGVVVPSVLGHLLDVPPTERTDSQGVALGHALQSQLGATYAQPIHFIGHSLGALVNAAAANYLHEDITAQEEISPTPWTNAPTHMTLFDHAEVAGLFGGISSGFAPFCQEPR
jgi:hypothetical protein